MALPPEALFGLGLLGWLVRIVSASRRKPEARQRPTPSSGKASVRVSRPATARKPATLEELRAEMLADLDRARATPAGPPVAISPTPPPKKLATTTGTSGNAGPARLPAPPTGEVDYDERAVAVVAARRAAAERHNAPLDETSHQAFHRRIALPPDTAAPVARPRPAFTAARAREAVVWREILDPPVALRPPRDD